MAAKAVVNSKRQECKERERRRITPTVTPKMHRENGVTVTLRLHSPFRRYQHQFSPSWLETYSNLLSAFKASNLGSTLIAMSSKQRS